MARQSTELEGCGRKAFLACIKHFFPLCALIALQLALRAVPFACLYPPVAGVSFGNEPVWVWYALFAFSYVLCVIPARFYCRETLRFYSAPGLKRPQGKKPYFAFLKAGIIRYLRGLIWGVPFLAGVGFFLYSMEEMPFNEQGMFFERLAGIAGFQGSTGLVAKGVMVYFAVLVLLGILFAWGWRNDLPVEFLPARSLGVKKTFLFSKKAKFRGKGQLLKNTLINLLLSLPAVLLAGAVLYPYVKDNLRVSGNILMTVRSVKRLIMQPLPSQILLLLALVAVLVYLPLCVMRKMRNAVLIRRLTQELDSREDRHAAG